MSIVRTGGEPDRPGSTVGSGARARSIEALGPQADDARQRRLGRIAGEEHFAPSVLGCSDTLWPRWQTRLPD